MNAQSRLMMNSQSQTQDIFASVGQAPYEAPTLTRFGTVVAMTAAGSGGVPEVRRFCNPNPPKNNKKSVVRC